MEQIPLDAPLRELNVGRALAEEGMALTLEAEGNRWFQCAIAALKRFAASPEWGSFKMEDFRAWYVAEQLPEPHDHHVWGALTNRAARANVIFFTGRYAPSVSPKTHGHDVKVWRGA